MKHYETLPTRAERKFFASSNSSQGFHNNFPRCFGSQSGIDLLYILKGGPGTGKSHLLKTLGRYAEAHGYETVYYYCSSDPVSLDGLITKKSGQKTWGFVDGTAPHVWEPTIPGVREEIINLGIFWHQERLQQDKEEIEKLCALKDDCYTVAYHDLAASGSSVAAADLLMNPFIKIEKLKGLAKRLTPLAATGRACQKTPAYLCSIGMKGGVRFDTYESMAHKNQGEILWIDRYYGLEYVLMRMIEQRLEEKGRSLLLSRDPVCPQKIDGIYDLESHTCFVTGLDDCTLPHRKINLRRYLDHEGFREIRGEVRHLWQVAKDLKACACDRIKKAGEYHFALEEIYAAAMDFKAKDQFDKALCHRLFGD